MSVTTPNEDEVPLVRPRRRRRMSRWPFVVLAGLGAMLIGFLLWYEFEVHAFGSSPGREVTLAIQPGEAVGTVVDELAAKGVIGSSLAFTIHSTIHSDPVVHPGYFSFPTGSTFGEVRSILAAPSNTNVLEVPAGFTNREIVARLVTQVRASYVAGVRTALHDGSVRSVFEPPDSKNLEGLVAPGRYVMPPSLTPKELVGTMVGRFDSMAKRLGLTPSGLVRGHSSYSVIIQASIVEKEGYQVRNMPKVARVIDNRLARSMLLQMDSTVLYDLHQDGGVVTRQTLATRSPYNTYLNKGLPPTPICVISEPALRAVLDPPPGPWLYFTVVDKTGSEAFSETFAEQLANERLAASRGL